MVGLNSGFFPTRRLLLISVFTISLLVRFCLICTTPNHNHTIDLNIYRDGGQLILNGVNPYDYSDNVALRNQLRLDTVAYTAWTSETQDRWDFYASSNLPLSVLFYAFVEYSSSGNPFIYRLIFGLIDATLALVIAIIILNNWKLNLSFSNFILITGVGALSPTLLLWGSSFPEEKGLQILFMLLAVLYAQREKMIWSAIFLSCSIAFKGLGVFIAPLCLYLLVMAGQTTFQMNKNQVKSTIWYISLTIIFSIFWFLPYMPEIFSMMQTRVNSNIGASITPEHGSIWRIVQDYFPEKWSQIKFYATIVICFLWGYVFLIRRINIPALSLFMLVFFVDILLLKGSMDRMNIGIIVSLVFFHFIDIPYAKFLAWFTILMGYYLYPINHIIHGHVIESNDAKYTLGYIILFCAYPLIALLKRKPDIVL